MRKPLFFKRKPPKEWSDLNYVCQVALRKNGKTLDMRFKETREFAYQTGSTRFSDFMQELSHKLGNKRDKWLQLNWKHYLNPIKQIKFRITGVWYL